MNHPFLYISSNTCQGSHDGGWSVPFSNGAGLPQVSKLIEALPEKAFSEKLAIFLPDSLLHPLRVTLEEKVPAKELDKFLLWKLKRYLPYPTDQCLLRCVPLAEPNTWLTFTLPKPWVDGLHQALAEKNCHSGYMGGAFSSWLDNSHAARGRVNLCFYADVYLMAELDGSGNWLKFQSRRLPFLDPEGERLDVETLLEQDLAGITADLEKPLTLVNLEPGLAGPMSVLARRLRESHQLIAPEWVGETHERLRACFADEGVSA